MQVVALLYIQDNPTNETAFCYFLLQLVTNHFFLSSDNNTNKYK